MPLIKPRGIDIYPAYYAVDSRALEYRDPLFQRYDRALMKLSRWAPTILTTVMKAHPLIPPSIIKISGSRGTVDYLGIGMVINRYSIDGTTEVHQGLSTST